MKNGSPIITIGMPVFNGEKYIANAIETLLEQTESRFKLIISDNASTDSTFSICQKYASADARIQLIKNEINKGPLYNFLNVLMLADTQYFMWAAHDDYWCADWIEKLVGLHDENTSITFGSVKNITLEKTLIRTYSPPSFRSDSKGSNISYYLEEDTKGKANLIYGVYKTNIIQKIAKRILGELKYADDMLFIYQFLQFGDIKTDHSTFLFKRVTYYPMPELTLIFIIKRLLLFDRLQSYFCYVRRSRGHLLKLLIFVLLPVKYLASLVVNLAILLKKN